MKTIITLRLHEDYVQVITRFYKESWDYVEYAFHGCNIIELIKTPCTIPELKSNVETFETQIDKTIGNLYLEGFKGHFSFTYELVVFNDITEFEVRSARFINPSRGGRNISGGFKDEKFRKKIFNNLLNAVADKDVIKLNKIMLALYNIGG